MVEPIAQDEAMQNRQWTQVTAVYPNGAVAAGPTDFTREPKRNMVPEWRYWYADSFTFFGNMVLLPYNLFKHPPTEVVIAPGETVGPSYTAQPVMPAQTVIQPSTPPVIEGAEPSTPKVAEPGAEPSTPPVVQPGAVPPPTAPSTDNTTQTAPAAAPATPAPDAAPAPQTTPAPAPATPAPEAAPASPTIPAPATVTPAPEAAPAPQVTPAPAPEAALHRDRCTRACAGAW